MRMAAIYGHKWVSAFPTEEAVEVAKREWQLGLKKIRLQDITHAIQHCKRYVEWPPSLPEFLGYCATDKALPSVSIAYREACQAAYPNTPHEWSHPAVYHAATAVGLFELSHKPESVTKPLFERAYEIVCRRVREGEDLSKPIPKSIQSQTSQKSDPKHVKEHLKAIYEKLGATPSQKSLINQAVGEQQ